MTRIVGIGGSMTDRPNSLFALKMALAQAEIVGAGQVQTQLFDVDVMRLPFLDTRSKETPQAALEMCEAVHQADALIWSTPLYHGTVSGVFKNAIDWLELLSTYEPKYLTDKFVGLICCAGGSQGLQAINSMEYAVRALRGFTLPLVVPIAQAWHVFDATGKCLDEKVALQLTAMATELVRVAGKK